MRPTVEYLGLVTSTQGRFHAFPAPLVGTAAARLVYQEVLSRGYPAMGAVSTDTPDPDVTAIDVTFRNAPGSSWSTAAHEIAATVTLLDRVVHAPNPVDGELLVNRLAAIQSSNLIPALAKSWLRSWLKWLHNDPEPDHRVNKANERMIGWVTARIALLDRIFPRILPESLFWPAPRLPRLVE